MQKKLTVRKVGNSLGITIPKEFLGKFELEEGSEVFLLTNEKGFFLTPYDPEYAYWAKALDSVKGSYRNLFQLLMRGGRPNEAD